MRAAQLCALVVAVSASAADVRVRATTVVSGAPELSNPAQTTRTLVPIVELVGLNARKLQLKGFDELAIVVDAWGSVLPTGVTLAGDVELAYLEGLTLDKHLRVRLGRQIIVGGAARMLAVDGLSAEAKFGPGLGVSAFVGNAVARRFSNFTRGDFTTGGRVFWSPSTDVQAGVSLTHLTERGIVVRQDVGVDGRWYLRHSLTLAGSAAYSLAEGRLVELDLGPRWQVTPELEVFAGWRRTAPDLFLSRTSIFSVFADTTRDQLGATAVYEFSRMFSLVGDGHAVWINSTPGYDLALRAVLRPQRSPATSVTAQVHRLSIPVNGYTQGRLAARHTLPVGLALSGDLDVYVLDKPVRATTQSVSFTCTATYAFSTSWLAGVSVMVGSSPFYESRSEVMGKVAYAFPELAR